MIRFALPPEPTEFDQRVRQNGKRWLSANPGAVNRAPAHWNEFRRELWNGFRKLCAYTAMLLPEHGGHVDHFVSKHEDPNLLYEWRNYRFCTGGINSSKQHLRSNQLLDPLEIEDGWFEIVLPSLELVVTIACPPSYRDRAQLMCKRLQLGRDPALLDYRAEVRDLFLRGELSLPGLERAAPLVALAIRKRLLAMEKEGIAEPENQDLLRALLTGTFTMAYVHVKAPTFAQSVLNYLHRLSPPVGVLSYANGSSAQNDEETQS